MNFTFPLVRFSKKHYLQELQQGSMYMRNACYYRAMESECGNTVQGDQLESKLPYYSGNYFQKILSKNNISSDDIIGNWSLMAANNFICCMYAFNESNIINRGENWITLGINRRQNDIKKFGEHALVICDVDRFIQSFGTTTIDCSYKQQGYVEYHDLYDHDIADVITGKYIAHLASTDPQKAIQRPEFIKNINYEYQQEYRFVVNTAYSPEDIVSEYQGIIKNDGIKIEIEDCTSHSFICSTEDLLSHTLCFKWENNIFKVGFSDQDLRSR